MVQELLEEEIELALVVVGVEQIGFVDGSVVVVAEDSLVRLAYSGTLVRVAEILD